MVYISTAYSQVDKINEVIEEKVYDLKTITPEKLIEMTRYTISVIWLEFW